MSLAPLEHRPRSSPEKGRAHAGNGSAGGSGNGTGLKRVARGFNISAWSIDHPYVIIAFFLGVLVLGAMVVFGGAMPRRMMPYVESPLVGIVTMAPGLSAKEVETYYSKPIEQRMTDIRGVRYIRSTSRDGQSIVTLEFPYGTDMRRATTDVQALMSSVQADLPQTGANAKPSWVLPVDPLNLPVLTLSLTGDPAQGWSPTLLRQFAINTILPQIKSSVADVQSVQVYGGGQRQLRVEVDRDKLAALGISILQVRDAIDRANVDRPAGALKAGQNDIALRTASAAPDAATVGGYPLIARGGRIVSVRDVASVTDADREQRSGYNFGSHDARGNTVIEGLNDDAVEVAVIEQAAASSPPVIAGVMKQVKRIELDNPGLHLSVAYDNAHFVNILFKNTGVELAIAVVLCGIVVLLFLGDWRRTVISLVTIPVSMAMALVLMAPFGFSLNSSTLIGLLLAIGRLVDDSVIDLHAIERHLKMGKTPRAATVDGITEVRLAVAASTFMLVLALVPLLVCGGITQLMFVGLVYPIIFGLLASFLVSLTLTAVLSSRLLSGAQETGRLDRALRPVHDWLERMDGRYQGLVRAALARKFTVISAALCAIAAGVVFYNLIGSEMMPLADVGQAYGVLEMKPGASYAQTAQATETLERLLLRHPEVERISTEIGDEPGGTYFTGYAMDQVNAATLMITLSDKDERRANVWQIVDQAQREAEQTIPNLRRVQIKEMGSDVMASSEAPVQLLVTGPDAAVSAGLAQQVADVARRTPGAYQVATSWDVERPSYAIHVDPQRALLLGLSPSDVAEQAYFALGGGLANEYYHVADLRQDTVDIRLRADQRRSVYDVERLPVTGSSGLTAPLNTIARVTPEKIPTLIEHDGLQPAVSVLAYYRKGGPPSMDLAMMILTQAYARLNFPPGYSLTMRGDMSQMMDSFARLLRGLEIAILFIFLVLVAQFGGFLSPLQMLLSIPLELCGVFAGLWLMHQAFSSVSIMAVIVLTGMDMTTAILLIDQIHRRRRDPSLTRDEAIALACRDRLRPILMTSLITIVTMAPVAFAPKTGMDAYQPLGTVVVFGLIAGTVLSLLVIPVMHAITDDVQQRFASRSPQA